AATIYSCSKQEQTKPTTTEISQSDADILMENKIRAFKSKMEFLRENPSYKSGESMSVDSAVWYMEAASNYTYADGASAFNKAISDTFSIVFDAINGTVFLNDVVEAYDDMIQNLSAAYQALPDENKHLVANDVTLTGIDATNVTFSIDAVFGLDIDGTANVFNHEWYWGLLMGRGDGAYLGISDAAEEIEKMIHKRKGTLPAYSYYSDIDSIYVDPEFFLNPNDPFPNDNMYDMLMFWNMDDGMMPNVHDLLSVDEMNFYLGGISTIIYSLEPDGVRPNGKNFISVDLVGDFVYGNNGSLRWHTGWVKYGILHLNSQPPRSL
ncbi:MAG: hypothetical protein WC271_15060, partial [Bacteroidales bacterium]